MSRLEDYDWSKAQYLGKDAGGSALRHAVGDTLTAFVGKGTIAAGEAVVGLANLPTFGYAGKALESIGYDPVETKRFIDRNLLSRDQRLANQRVEDAEGFVGTAGAMLQNPSTIVGTALESLPSTFGGGAIGQVARKALPKLGTLAAAALGEGAVAAGAQAEGIRQQTDDGLLSGKQVLSSLASGALTGGIGAAGGSLARKLGISDIDTALVQGSLAGARRSLPARVAGGALSEGVFEELPQSLQEQMWENYALDRPLLDNLGKAAAQGMFAGAAMGAGANVFHGGHPPADAQDAPDAGAQGAQGTPERLALPPPAQGVPPYDPFTDSPFPPAPPAAPAGPLQRAVRLLTEGLPARETLGAPPAQGALGVGQGVQGEVLPPQDTLPSQRPRLPYGGDIIEGEFSPVENEERTYQGLPAANKAQRESGRAEDLEVVNIAPQTFALREKTRALPAPQAAQETQRETQEAPTPQRPAADLESYRAAQASTAQAAEEQALRDFNEVVNAYGKAMQAQAANPQASPPEAGATPQAPQAGAKASLQGSREESRRKGQEALQRAQATYPEVTEAVRGEYARQWPERTEAGFAQDIALLSEAIGSKNIDHMRFVLAAGANQNPKTARIFEKATGLKLSRQLGKRREELDAWAGITPEQRAQLEREKEQRWQQRKADEAEQKRLEHNAQLQRAREEAAHAPELDGYLQALSPKRREEAEKALRGVVRTRGEGVQTLHRWVENRHKAGSAEATQDGRKYRVAGVKAPKAAYDYARHLLTNKVPPETQAPNAPEKRTEQTAPPLKAGHLRPIPLKLEGWTGSTSELARLAREIYTRDLQGEVVDNASLGERIAFTSEGKGEAFGAKGRVRSQIRLELVRVLRELVQSAVKVGEEAPTKKKREKDSRAFHTMLNALEVGGRVIPVRLTVREALHSAQGEPPHKFYDVAIPPQNKRSPDVHGVRGGEPAARPVSVRASDIKVAELAAAFNSETPKAQEPAQKAKPKTPPTFDLLKTPVDDNGQPSEADLKAFVRSLPARERMAFAGGSSDTRNAHALFQEKRLRLAYGDDKLAALAWELRGPKASAHRRYLLEALTALAPQAAELTGTPYAKLRSALALAARQAAHAGNFEKAASAKAPGSGATLAALARETLGAFSREYSAREAVELKDSWAHKALVAIRAQLERNNQDKAQGQLFGERPPPSLQQVLQRLNAPAAVAYPKRGERPAPAKAPDKPFSTRQTREDKQGNTVLFSRRNTAAFSVPVEGVKQATAEKALAKLAEKPLHNRDTGIEAFINTNQAGKLVSNAAVHKSEANGFTREQHYAMVARIEHLWENALQVAENPDKNGQPGIFIKRFAVPVVLGGRTHYAMITAKATVQHGHRIYSLEAHAEKTLRGLLDKANTADGLTLIPSRSAVSIMEALEALVNSDSPAASRFSPSSKAQPAELSPQQKGHLNRAKAVVERVRKAWANAPEVVVAHSMDDPQIPEAARRENARQQAGGAKGNPEGFFYQGKVYLLADALKTPADAARVLLHEVLGHYGLRGHFGKELDGVLNGIATLRQADVKAKLKEYGLADTEVNRRIAAEEVLAKMAQTRPDMGWAQRAIAAIRTWLRQNVPALRGMVLSQSEILQNYLLPARRYVEQGLQQKAQGNGKAAFGRGKEPTPGSSTDTIADMKRKARVLQGAPVAVLTGEEAPHAGFAALRGWAAELFKEQGGKALSAEIGEVVLDERAVRDSTAHGMSYYKAAAFAAVKDVIEQGVVVLRAAHGALDSFYISAPIVINGVDNIATALVRRSPDTQRLYLHGVVTKEGLLGSVRATKNSGGAVSEYTGTQSGTDATHIAVKHSGKADPRDVNNILRELLQVNLDPVGERDKGLQLPNSVPPMQGQGKSVLTEADVVKRVQAESNEPPPLFSRSDMDSATREALGKLGLVEKDQASLLDNIRALRDGGLKDWLKAATVRAEEGLFDGLLGIKKAEQALGIKDAQRQGYTSARLASGLADVVHAVLHYGAPQWKNGVIARKAGTRGLLDILSDIGAKELNRWLGWLGGKRAELLMQQGRENNLSAADIAELLALGKGKEALFERVYREYQAANEAVLDVAQEAGLINPQQRKAWMSEYYVPFYRMTEGEVFAAPSTRSGLSHQSAAIRALKGGALPTQNLLSNILTAWTTRLDASLKNKALLEVVDNLKGSEYLTDESLRWKPVVLPRAQVIQKMTRDANYLRAWLEHMGLAPDAGLEAARAALAVFHREGFEQFFALQAPTDPDVIRVQRAGKNEYYRVHNKSLLRGVKFVTQSTANDPLTKMGRAFKRLLTTGVTASPDFILRNFLRDAAHTWAINRDGFKFAKDSLKGLKQAWVEDEDYRTLMFSGASFQGGYILGGDADAAAQMIKRALARKGLDKAGQDAYLKSLVKNPQDLLKSAWESYRGVSDKVENANRLAHYKAALAAGKSAKQAAFEAKDLMDFSLRGNFALAVYATDLIPFLNARMQGLYKLGRAITGELPTDKGFIAREVAIKGAYIALFSLLLAGANGDDDRYKALKDWDKDANWHFWFSADQAEPIRIPKPFEIGLLFGTLPERLFHALTGNQSGGDFGRALVNGVVNTLEINPVPQFVRPAVEVWANRDSFFDVPIESLSDANKLKSARYNERTSALGKTLGQATGPLLNLSPKQIDHLVRGYAGTLGGYVLSLSNLAATAGSDAAAPAFTPADVPMLGVLYKGERVAPNRYREEFYDLLRESQQIHQTVQAYRKEGRADLADELANDHKEVLARRRALSNANKQLARVRERIKALYRDPLRDSRDKREELNRLQKQANEIAARAVRIEKAMGR